MLGHLRIHSRSVRDGRQQRRGIPRIVRKNLFSIINGALRQVAVLYARPSFTLILVLSSVSLSYKLVWPSNSDDFRTEPPTLPFLEQREGTQNYNCMRTPPMFPVHTHGQRGNLLGNGSLNPSSMLYPLVVVHLVSPKAISFSLPLKSLLALPCGLA